MKKRILSLAILSILVLWCGAAFAQYAITDQDAARLHLKKPASAKEAYAMMTAAYKDCMKAIADFSAGSGSGAASDEKLKIYIYYKGLYEKMAASGLQQAEAPNFQSTQAPAAAPAQTGSAKADKLIASIKKYEPNIGAVPPVQGGRFFRQLFGQLTVADLMADGYAELQKGNNDKAADLFAKVLAKQPANKDASFFLAQAKLAGGNAAEAEKILAALETKMRDAKWFNMFKAETDPWVEAQVAFKIGGFDSLEDYKKKIAAGNRKELHGDEYYEKFVNPRTYKYYSKEAEKEFNSIAGIDCGGLVQRVYMDMCKKNGVKPPFNSKIPGRELKKYANAVPEDGGVPPMNAKPGDFMLLKEHDGWGHAFMFAGRTDDGRPIIVEASGEGRVLRRVMPDRYYQYYGGTYRFKDMDKIREKMMASAQ